MCNILNLLRLVQHLQLFLERCDFATATQALITLSLDYYVGLSLRITWKPQLVENVVVRLLMVSSYRDHILLVFKELHWFPIHFQD